MGNDQMKSINRIKINYIYIVLLLAVTVISVFLFLNVRKTKASFDELREIIDINERYGDAFEEMNAASDFLTDKARYFVTTGNREYLLEFLEEVRVTKRREKALSVIYEGEGESDLYQSLKNSLDASNDLANTELYAMILAAEAYGVDTGDLDLDEYGIIISEMDKALSPHGKKDRAISLLFDENYMRTKTTIQGNITEGINALKTEVDDRKTQSEEKLNSLLRGERTLLSVVFLLVLIAIGITEFLLVIPLNRNIRHLKNKEFLPTNYVSELAYFSNAYNDTLLQQNMSIEKLSYEASHDSLTGLYNRMVFESERRILSGSDIALILIDIDKFKDINDTYGHDAGDRVLKRVGEIIAAAFRSTDFPCRIGGDEFAVILLKMTPEYLPILMTKLDQIRNELKNSEGIPEATLSIGGAFNNGELGEDELFKKADMALYEAKNKGKNLTVIKTD
ncbi:MAG: GGDEF domain-containing protein [Clostridia bacterium]|nr:GGDEF domain-containing protein [Clostridia bacterium]